MRRDAALLALALACACGAISACGRKSAGAPAAAAPGVSGAYASYAGAWKIYMTKTAQTEDCKAPTDGSLQGPELVSVDARGRFSRATGEEDSGWISGSGAVSGTFSDGPTCGSGPWTGTCMSHAMCSGSYVTYGIVHDRVVQGESGTWMMTR